MDQGHSRVRGFVRQKAIQVSIFISSGRRGSYPRRENKLNIEFREKLLLHVLLDESDWGQAIPISMAYQMSWNTKKYFPQATVFWVKPLQRQDSYSDYYLFISDFFFHCISVGKIKGGLVKIATIASFIQDFFPFIGTLFPSFNFWCFLYSVSQVDAREREEGRR